MADPIDQMIADEVRKAQVLAKNRQGTTQDRVIVHLAARLRQEAERANTNERKIQFLQNVIETQSATSFDRLFGDMLEWQNATFTKATPSSKAEHLRREAVELCESPDDLEELADIVFLAIHANNGRDLKAALRAKFAKNKARTWKAPDADGCVEHAAEGDV